MKDFRRLECFVVVAEELNFSRAARRLHLSQPPLSRQIQSLEEDLGIALLVRNAKRVELTTAGRAYLAEARKILSLAERASELAKRTALGKTRQIRILHSGSVMYCDASQALFSRLWGLEMEPSFVESTTVMQYDALLRGAADIGFNVPYQIESPEGIKTRLVFREPLVVCRRKSRGSPARTVDLAALADEPLVLYGQEMRAGLNNRVLGLFHAAGVRPGRIIEVTQFGAIPTLVASGAGVSILPASTSRMNWPELEFLALADVADFGVYAAWTERTPPELLAAMGLG